MTETSIGVILAAAVIAATAVDILKDVIPVRGLFNRWAVQRWLFRGLGYRLKFWPQLCVVVRKRVVWLEEEKKEKKGQDGQAGKKDSDENVERTVVRLAAAGDIATMYRPELAQVAAQLNILAEQLLDFPSGKRRVLCALAGVAEATPSKAPALIKIESAGDNGDGGAAVPDTPRDDVEKLCALDSFRAAITAAEAAERSPGLGKTKADSGADAGHEDAGTLMDRRSRVTGLIQHRLDQLQTTGRASWRVFLLVAATLIGAKVSNNLLGGTFGFDLTKGLFAGILATIVHDVLAILRRAGRR